MWPIGSSSALLLVQKHKVSGLPRFLFLAQTRDALWMALDIFDEDGGCSRIALANVYAGFSFNHMDGGDMVRNGWWVAEPSAVHRTQAEPGTAATEMVVISIAGFASSVDEALAFPTCCSV
jgi:hypothetical protein